jgi:hypothetical protein
MEDWKYKEAQKRVKKMKDFYGHFTSYLIMSVFFIFINLFTSRGYFWAIWPILGWGIGIAFHAMDVFGFPGIGKDWEERQLEKEMDRLRDHEAAKKWEEYSKSSEYTDENQKSLPEADEEFDLRELKELRRDWKDSDFV